MKFHRGKGKRLVQRSICIMYSKYRRAKVCTSRESAIIIFRIKPCYTFGHTKRLRLFTRPRARETCTHLWRIISDAWEKNFHETFSSRKTCIVRRYFTLLVYYCTQITEETKIKEAKIRHISPTETTEGTISLIPRLYIVFHFSSFLSFIFFPLPSLTTTIYRISSLLKHRVRVSLSHCNQRIHFPKHYVSRSAGHRAEALDHRSLSRRVRTWGFLCDAQGEGRMENKEKKKTGRRKK